jgi:hypothetical protein
VNPDLLLLITSPVGRRRMMLVTLAISLVFAFTAESRQSIAALWFLTGWGACQYARAWRNRAIDDMRWINQQRIKEWRNRP